MRMPYILLLVSQVISLRYCRFTAALLLLYSAVAGMRARYILLLVSQARLMRREPPEHARLKKKRIEQTPNLFFFCRPGC
jgi:hypothetical protein